MPKRYRVPSKRAKWYLPRYEYITVVNFCLQYPELKAKAANVSGIRAVTYDGMPHGSGVGDPTARQAAILAEAERKIEIIERNVKEVAGNLAPWMLKGITDDKMTYDKLRYDFGFPMNATYYWSMRREIYWKIAQEI